MLEKTKNSIHKLNTSAYTPKTILYDNFENHEEIETVVILKELKNGYLDISYSRMDTKTLCALAVYFNTRAQDILFGDE